MAEKITTSEEAVSKLVAKIVESGLTKEDISVVVKELEEQTGLPVEVVLKVGVRKQNESAYVAHQIAYHCFNLRSVMVERVNGLEPRFIHDVELLEGDYPTLEEVENRVLFKLNAFYEFTVSDERGQKAYEAARFLKERFPAYTEKGKGLDFMLYSLPIQLYNHLQIPEIKLECDGRQDDKFLLLSEASKALDEAGIQHLKYYIRIGPDCAGPVDGLYAAMVPGGKPIAKVANIQMQLLK